MSEAETQKTQEFRILKENLEKWNKSMMALASITLEDSLALLKKFEINLPRMVIPNSNVPTQLYRARVINADSGEDLTNPSTFSYAPARFTTTFQRANAPGYPVFYGTLDGKTALEELRINGRPLQKGERVFLSEWKLKENHTISLCYLTLNTIIKEEQLLSGATENVYRELERIFKNEEPGFAKAQKFLFEEMGRLFLTGSHLQSGTIAHDILFRTPPVDGYSIDGILYPSCANQFRSANCALLPSFVDRSLELQSVQEFTFNQFSDTGAFGNTRYHALIQEQKVNWYCYYSEIFPGQFTYSMSISEQVSEEVKFSYFFLYGKKLDIWQYCKEQAQLVDPSRKFDAIKDQQLFLEGTDTIHTHSLDFPHGEACLYYIDHFILLAKITLRIKLKLYMKQVDQSEVLKTTSTIAIKIKHP